MEIFIPPVNGMKLGEFYTPLIKRFKYRMSWFRAFGMVLFALLIIGGWGVKIIHDDTFNISWLSWLVGIGLCIFGLLMAYGAWNDVDLDCTIINKKNISLFIVESGVEIDKHFLQFRPLNIHLSEATGIVSFKLDGDFLIIKTNLVSSFISAYGQNESEMKFKIESKYLSFKDELLVYLNSLIVKS